jgi:hypothetical protein
MSRNSITIALLLGHILFRGFFTPVLVFVFAWELNRYVSVLQNAQKVQKPESLRHANFIMNQAVFIPVFFSALAFAFLLLFAPLNWVTLLSHPMFSSDAQWLTQMAGMSADNSNSLMAGYIGYMLSAALSIFFRERIACGIIDRIHSKIPGAIPGSDFTYKSAWMFAIAGFLMADVIVGYLAHELSTPSSGKRWFLPYCFFILPAGSITATWLSAFGLTFTNIFRKK